MHLFQCIVDKIHIKTYFLIGAFTKSLISSCSEADGMLLSRKYFLSLNYLQSSSLPEGSNT